MGKAIIDVAKRVLDDEASGLSLLRDFFDTNFVNLRLFD